MDSATIEQMNELRKRLGLPLLGVPSTSNRSETTTSGPSFKAKSHNEDGDDSDDEPASTLETREAAGFANFKAIQDEETKRLEREKRKKAIQKARDTAERMRQLEGKGLGDVDEDEKKDMGAKAWLKGSKKRQQEIDKARARKFEEEEAERERLAALEYTSADLAGVQVAHELDDFEGADGDQILTLADREIGKDGDDSEDGDVLENADIKAKDRLKDKLDLKKKKAYDVHADASEQGLLSQYDDKKRKAFTLDGQGRTIEERDAKRQAIGEKLKNTISLDIFKAEPVSDYQEIKIKKPKRTKKKSLRQKEADEDDIFPAATNGVDAMEVDNILPETKPKVKSSDTIFNDDEDLASALSFSRRTALKKKKTKPEDLIRQLQEEEDAGNGQLDGIVVDDTTTFLDNLTTRGPEDDPTKPAQQTLHTSIEKDRHSSPDTADSPEDTAMAEAHAVTADDEEELLDRLRREQSTHTPDISHSGLNEEQALDQGMGAALNLLRQRGLVKNSDDPTNKATADKNKLYRDRQKFVLDSKLRTHEAELKARAQRERDRNSGKLQNMSVREREEHARWQNTQREHATSIAAAAAFNREYKPDVQIKYVDDDGRLMNQKEAFKQLSHQFHGKGSGKGKTEKRIKKLDDEKRREARSVLDSSMEGSRGYEGAATHQRKGKEAGVRLQ